jgi:hypothetical protein
MRIRASALVMHDMVGPKDEQLSRMPAREVGQNIHHYDHNAVNPVTTLARPAQRSLTLRPARSPCRLATLSIEGFSGFVAFTTASIATGWSEPSSRTGLSPAEIQRLFMAHFFANY